MKPNPATSTKAIHENASEVAKVGVSLSENIVSPGLSEPIQIKKAMQAAVTA